MIFWAINVTFSVTRFWDCVITFQCYLCQPHKFFKTSVTIWGLSKLIFALSVGPKTDVFGWTWTVFCIYLNVPPCCTDNHQSVEIKSPDFLIIIKFPTSLCLPSSHVAICNVSMWYLSMVAFSADGGRGFSSFCQSVVLIEQHRDGIFIQAPHDHLQPFTILTLTLHAGARASYDYTGRAAENERQVIKSNRPFLVIRTPISCHQQPSKSPNLRSHPLLARKMHPGIYIMCTTSVVYVLSRTVNIRPPQQHG